MNLLTILCVALSRCFLTVADDVRVMQEVLAATPEPDQVSTTGHYMDVRQSRYSKKMGKTIPLDGVKGHLQLEGAMRDVLPWLAVGEQLQLRQNDVWLWQF